MMGVGNIEGTTSLYIDMLICTEFLNCTHEDFLKLPRIERKKLKLFAYVKGMKLEEEEKKRELKAREERLKTEAKQMDSYGRKR